jgi:DNA replication protein DnaC
VNLIEIDRALRKLRLSGMADVLEIRIQGASSARQPHVDFLSTLVGDELQRRQDRLLARRITEAGFRDNGKSLDAFDLDFNKKMNRQLVYELATARFVEQREDVLFLGAPGTGKSPRASTRPRSNRDIACSIAKRTSCSKRCPTPRSKVDARK